MSTCYKINEDILSRHPVLSRSFHQMDTKSSSLPKVPVAKYHQQGQIETIPNISLTFVSDSYEMKFRGVYQSLVIKRAPNATIGEPWPLPQKYIVNNSNVFRISRETLKVTIRNNSCDILQQAIERFKENIYKFSLEEYYSNLVNIEASGFENLENKYRQSMYTKSINLTSLHIYVNTKCDVYPSLESDESYNLLVKAFGIVLMSNQVWGALRGLETLSQLVFSWKDQLYIRDTLIRDFPRFKHRGVLIDSARHFMTNDVIYDVLEAMSQNKMNVLHWHMVDDQSFSYQSKVFPHLSEKGAYHPSLVYTHDDIADVIEYARLRGIRVIPEFDTPGHTYSWGLGYPDVLTQCFDNKRQIPGYYGPLNPVRNTTYDFLRKLFSEVFDVFPEKYVHLGGDEVPMECWMSNPEVQELSKSLNQAQNQVYGHVMKPVWEYYTYRLLQIVKELRDSKNNSGYFILWEEASKNNLNIPKDTVIQIWMGGGTEVNKAIEQGYRVLYSSCWYLDHSKYGVHWVDYYLCDPTQHNIKNKQNEDKILGGEVCLWSEFITSETAMTMLWPRASAAAERLWSSSEVKSISDAGRRLQEHRCRMLRRGLQVGHINGPDYCMVSKYREELRRGTKRSVYKRSARWTESIRQTNSHNTDPLIIGLVFSTSGAFIVFLFVCLKFKSRVFVICWTFR